MAHNTEGSAEPKAAHCWHNVAPADQKRIRCQKGSCDNPATICEHSPWKVNGMTGLSFWYFCEEHGSGLREILPEYRHAEAR